jgi:hypothetical protein
VDRLRLLVQPQEPAHLQDHGEISPVSL